MPAISEAELQSTWWFEQGFTDLASAPGTPPDWASLQRNYSEMLRGVAWWWIDRREIGGQLGGGSGDDVEAAAVVVPRLAVSEGFTDFVEGGFKRVLDQVIEAPNFDEAVGFVRANLPD